MKKVNYNKVNKYITRNVILPFYKIRLEKLKKIKLSTIIKRKNPYLFKAKNIETAGDFAKNILDAFLSSQEETIFGDLLETFAIYICGDIFKGYKAQKGKYRSVDLIFERDDKIYVVGIKSGPNWGNSDQINKMKENFRKAKDIVKKEKNKSKIVAVNGCMYGTDNKPFKKDKRNYRLNYYKICGQEFWELISGDDQLYKKIIQPLEKEAKKKDEVFKDLYTKKINKMTEDIIDLFCVDNSLDWDKIIDYVSKKK